MPTQIEAVFQLAANVIQAEFYTETGVFNDKSYQEKLALYNDRLNLNEPQYEILKSIIEGFGSQTLTATTKALINSGYLI